MTRYSAARALALAIFAAVLAGLSSASQAQQSGDSHQGILTVRWGDPHRNSTASTETHFGIVYPDGTRVTLDVGPELRNEAIQHAGKRVTVRGSATAAESGRTRIKVESIESTEAGPRTEAGPGTEAAVTRKVLYILLRFQNDNQQPHTPAFYRNMTNPKTPSAGIPATINGFFDKVSYGALQWSGTVAGNKWYRLPRTRAQYCLGNCGPNGADINLDLLADDALALVAGDVNVNAFQNINFVFNNDLDCCAWGGGYSNGMRSWGATWEPPWGQEPGVYVHELGHSLGLPHSGWRYHAYDSQHDQMSDGAAASMENCGTYNSVNFGGSGTVLRCVKPGGGFIAAHQDFLGWIPNANKRTHSTVGSKVYTIEANSAPLGARLKLVRVCLLGFPCSGAEGTNARFITIEVKLRGTDFDNGIPSQGVVIHDVLMNRRNTISGPCYFNNQSGWAVPFDAGGNDWNASTCSGEGLADMAYAAGAIFRNNALGVKVEVGPKSGNTYKVTVTKTK